MSHIASVDCFVTDLEDARVAGEACGFDLMVGQRTYKWYGTWMNDSNLAPGHNPATFGQCEHALRLKGAQMYPDSTPIDYEIGLVRRIDGGPGWELLHDNWAEYGRRLYAKAGQNLATLKDEIAAAAAIRTLQRQGMRVIRTVNAQGEIELRGMA